MIWWRRKPYSFRGHKMCDETKANEQLNLVCSSENILDMDEMLEQLWAVREELAE